MIEKISDKITVIFTEEGFSRSNSVLVKDGERLMIDSGPGKILEQFGPEKIDTLLNSHCHLDHIWDNDLFVNARILMHHLESENIKVLKNLGGFENWDSLMDSELQQYIDMLISMKPSFLNERKVDGTFGDGDFLSAGNTGIQVLHTPGHTSGHCSFFIPSEGFVFTGDICLTKVGPWYGDDSTPIDDFINSVNRIIDLKADRLVTGHNREVLTENIGEKLEEYRDRIFRREEKILAAIKESPRDLHELADIPLIYPSHPSIFVLYWEKAMLKKHLDHLVVQGRAAADEEGRYHFTE